MLFQIRFVVRLRIKRGGYELDRLLGVVKCIVIR